jgi:hypothetical protein
MKKKLGIFSVAIIAVASFYFTQNDKAIRDVDLASLVSLNEAQAEIIIISTECSYIGFEWAECTDGPFTFSRCIPDPTLGCRGVL